MLKRNKLEKIDDIRAEIKQEYLNTDLTPWIIGYSGGKDSTTVLQLVVEALLELERENRAKKMVYVISSDTLVENPLVLRKTTTSMKNLAEFAKDNKLPLKAEMIYPESDNTFFVKLIGSGYPSPLQSFRWCTDRIKIMPANKFIYSKVSESGEVILLLGTREEESVSRKLSMQKHYIDGSNLSLHSSIPSAWTYSPIAHLTVNEVWGYLLKNSCPWGDNNNDLYIMYSSSIQDGECPLVIDKETKEKQTCGNSRFGCWTCTIVAEDKSLKGFIESGETWLTPLLEYRNYLIKIRDDEACRNIFDRNGNIKKVDVKIKGDSVIIPKKLHRDEVIISLSKAVSEQAAYKQLASGDYNLKTDPIIVKNGSEYYRVGLSSFTIETRVKLLRKLFETEKLVRNHLSDYLIITKEEIIAIDNIWKDDGYLDYSAIAIYNEYREDNILSSVNNIDFELLKHLCFEENFDENTLHAIIRETSKNVNIKNRNKNIKSIESKLATQRLLLRDNYEDK
ncbi:MAG: DNA phosphorothioation system sulfurtransferase DndC [Bacilli bacterium]